MTFLIATRGAKLMAQKSLHSCASLVKQQPKGVVGIVELYRNAGSIMSCNGSIIVFRRGVMSSAIHRRMESMVKRHEEVMQQIMDSSSADNNSNEMSVEVMNKNNIELASLSHIVSLKDRYDSMEEEIKTVQDLLEEVAEVDEEMKNECEEDIRRLERNLLKIEKRITQEVLRQFTDNKNNNGDTEAAATTIKAANDITDDAIVEIRAGTGGDEASLFANELLQTYVETAKLMNWKIDILSVTKTDLGGIREGSISITSGSRGGGGGSYNYDDGTFDDDGDDDENEDDEFAISSSSNVGPYGLFKYESGGHRVQRVPVTDTSRIHTSACSVAVLPSESDSSNASSSSQLPMSDLRIETMRASGAGGQHVNTTDSAVRITHIPTGITASIQDERSQHKNKAKALKLIAARVFDQKRMQEEKQRGETRSSLMGGGDRSERIRTYNYPQDRVTDHRCKHSLFGIPKLLSGKGDDTLVFGFYPKLQAMRQEELLMQIEKEEDDKQGQSKK